MTHHLSKANRHLKGHISLDGSKSISNRVLIIRALSGAQAPIDHLSTSKDTTTMQRLLSDWRSSSVLDAGAAGTTFRFLTGYLALQAGSQVLTGSARMKKRPIGLLVDALRQLGADIRFLEQDGYPPLQLNAPTIGRTNQLTIPANVSSQFISSLLMIAPYLPNGLELTLDGKIVSRPYIEMTLALMGYFGVTHEWNGQVIHIEPQQYIDRPFTVEADWSAASYYYSLAALADEVDFTLGGLQEDSLQGDSVLTDMMEQFGIKSTFEGDLLRLQKTTATTGDFEWDFIRCPDLAQTIAVLCAAKGRRGVFTGLETLRIKETDRIAAVNQELRKVGASFTSISEAELPEDKAYYAVEGRAVVSAPSFATYEDHRMAMAFAPLAMLGGIYVEEPDVVQKSYGRFWQDLQKLGFEWQLAVNQ